MRIKYLFCCFLLFSVYGAIFSQNVFMYEYYFSANPNRFETGEGGAGYKTADGTFYISGRTLFPLTDDDAYLMKINSDGTKNFTKQFILGPASSNEYISYGRLTSDGGYLLYGTTDFNNPGGYDILLIKTNSAGAVSWSREIKGAAGVNFPLTSRFCELSGGGYLLTGTVSGAGAGSSDAFVMGISSDGNTVNFANAYGDSRGQHSYDIIEHSSGEISFGGYSFMTGAAPGSNRNAWWVELSAAGAVNFSKTIGNANAEEFRSVIETTGNNYLALASWCSGVTACSGGLVEINASTGARISRKIFETSPVGTVFSPSCFYRTPDNSNYWIGGQYVTGGSDNDALMIKTSAATPAPSTGYVIGDTDEQQFNYSSGAVPGNDEFVLGGTENIGFGTEWRSTLVKGQSAIQCNSTIVSFTTSNWITTDLVNLAITNTGLTGLTLYNLDTGPDLVAVDRTATTTAVQSCFTSLPVSLLSFSGIPENNSVKLLWATASEENNNYFTLERSTDGHTFTEIGKINGAGNASTVRNYDFIDESPAQQNYYRLSQTDFNGEHKDLGIISVRLSNNEEQLLLSIQSNPVINNTLSLNLFSAEENDILISVTDLQGRSLFREKYYLQKGENRLFSVDLEALSLGTYFISATSRNSSVTRKILLLRGE